MKCLYYNYNTTSDTSCIGSYKECSKKLDCPFDAKLHVGHHCFVVWEPGSLSPLSAGCNLPYKSATDEKCSSECMGQPRGPRYYCCCTGNLCNQEFKSPPTQISTTPPTQLPKVDAQTGTIVVWPVLSIALIVTLVAAYTYRYMRGTNTKGLTGNLDESRNNDILIPFRNASDNYFCENNRTITETRIDLNCVKLLEIIGSGRFGTVHRASLNESSEIAVKIIPSTEHQSWLNEQQIFNSPNIKHPNILNFLGSDEHLETESYWLIVEYAPKGSLYSFLKDNVITWKEFLHIALGITHGLSHLHEADIAHRDFKSKNVLLKHDLTPCITDFGVAAMLDTSTGSQLDHRKKYLQVGTPRYMAPEILECSVTFTKASFTKIDVYALSLVLWELISRYREELPEDGIPPYKLPFEDVAGPNPDINKMRQIVVVEKLRPTLREEWRIYPASEFCRAIEDGWEYDHDARISASCFVERVESLCPQCVW